MGGEAKKLKATAKASMDEERGGDKTVVVVAA